MIDKYNINVECIHDAFLVESKYCCLLDEEYSEILSEMCDINLLKRLFVYDHDRKNFDENIHMLLIELEEIIEGKIDVNKIKLSRTVLKF